MRVSLIQIQCLTLIAGESIDKGSLNSHLAPVISGEILDGYALVGAIQLSGFSPSADSLRL